MSKYKTRQEQYIYNNNKNTSFSFFGKTLNYLMKDKVWIDILVVKAFPNIWKNY